MTQRARFIDRKTGRVEDCTNYYRPEDSMADVAAALTSLCRPVAGSPLGFRYELRPKLDGPR